MAKPMPLMDRVHAWTFGSKVKGVRINPAMAEVQRILRAKLRSAERFSLDDDSVRLITRLANEQDRLEGWSCLARLPHDVMWVEYDFHVHGREVAEMGNDDAFDPDKAAERRGYLMFRDSTDPECPRWVAHDFLSFSGLGVEPADFVSVFDPEGDGKFPVRGSQFWNKPTASLRPGFPRTALKAGTVLRGAPAKLEYDFECDVELMLLGLFEFAAGADGETLTGLGPSWLTSRFAAIVDPWRDALYAGRSGELDRKIVERSNGAGGVLLWLIAMLAAINGLPRDVRYHHPRAGKHSVGMHQLPYFGASTIEIAIPRENRLIYARKLLDKDAKVERHLRRHKVIGHWRVVDRARRVTFLCRHLPVIPERGYAMCERCEMLVRWIEPHERGDATLGIVNHDYEVTT